MGVRNGSKRLVFSCIICILFLHIFTPLIVAAELQTAFIRPARLATGVSPLPILVTFTPATLATENQLKVVVADAWGLSGSPSSFTVDVSSLPIGVNAVPGITTAQSVSGSELVFPISDLSPGTLYGFYITGGIYANPAAGDGESFLWKLETYSGVSVIDTTTAMVSVNANDQITVSATVNANANDLSATLSTLTAGSSFSQNETIEYEITYGSQLPYNSTVTIQAEWDLGTIVDEGSSTVSVLDYVDGSATNAYAATVPVIDTNQRTITWTITDFPAGVTGEKVRFALITGGYTGSSEVLFDVSARVLTPSVTPDSTISLSYTYQVDEQPTSTEYKKSCNALCSADSECASNYCLLGVGRCRHRQNSASDTCQPPPSPIAALDQEGSDVSSMALTLTHHRIDQITDSSVHLSATSSIPSTLIMRYGQSPNQLQSSASSSQLSNIHSLHINGLSPKTTYYYQFELMDATGNKYTSSLFSFTTSTQASMSALDPNSVQITSGGVSLFPNPILPIKDSALQALVMPPFTHVDLRVGFKQFENITKVYVAVRRDHINGDSMNKGRGSEKKLQEFSAGQYSGSIEAPHVSGWYTIIVGFQDVYGNKTEQEIALLHSTAPMLIRDSEKQFSIPGAEILFYVFNTRTKLFDRIQGKTFLDVNPAFTLSDGTFPIVLPLGRYKAYVSAAGYESKELVFTIGSDETATYPTIDLEPSRFTFSDIFKHQMQLLSNIYNSTEESIKVAVRSTFLFKIIAITAQVILAFLTILAFTTRTHISLFQLPQYTRSMTTRYLNKFRKSTQLIHGYVIDELNTPISQAQISLMNPISEEILQQTVTNKLGAFHLPTSTLLQKISISAKGYAPLIEEFTIIDSNAPTFTLKKSEALFKSVAEHILWYGKAFVGFLFEGFLLLSIGVQILYGRVFGIVEVVPFLTIAIINLFLWMEYLSSARSPHSVKKHQQQ